MAPSSGYSSSSWSAKASISAASSLNSICACLSGRTTSPLNSTDSLQGDHFLEQAGVIRSSSSDSGSASDSFSARSHASLIHFAISILHPASLVTNARPRSVSSSSSISSSKSLYRRTARRASVERWFLWFEQHNPYSMCDNGFHFASRLDERTPKVAEHSVPSDVLKSLKILVDKFSIYYNTATWTLKPFSPSKFCWEPWRLHWRPSEGLAIWRPLALQPTLNQRPPKHCFG